MATPIVACKPTDTLFSQTKAEEWRDITDTGLPAITPIGLPEFSQKIELIGDEANLSHQDSFSLHNLPEPIGADRTKLSTKYGQGEYGQGDKDLCPKLVESELDAVQIERDFNASASNSCDYYLYPDKGQTLSVHTEPRSIKAYLISPMQHDFDNGAVLVEQSDKYVVRLKFAGMAYPLDQQQGEVTINLQ